MVYIYVHKQSINKLIQIKNAQKLPKHPYQSLIIFQQIQIDKKTTLVHIYFLYISQQFKFPKQQQQLTLQPYRTSMNSRQISLLFKQNTKKQFNPVETFGTRQTVEKQFGQHQFQYKTKNKRINEESGQSRKADFRRDLQKQQTRIRLLTSFQQSYLQSVSQPIFTEPDQVSEIKRKQKCNTLSYSQSRRAPHTNSNNKNNNNQYLNSQPDQQSKSRKQKKEQVLTFKQLDKNRNSQSQSISKIKKAVYRTNDQTKQTKRNENLQDKIKVLHRSIQQQTYNISIQERLYDYLMARIDERGRLKKQRDSHQIVEKAIDFMDSGEQFMREYVKLKKIYKQV